jgi:hypothetical protein
MDHDAVHALWSSWHAIPPLQALAAVRVRWNASDARARTQGAGYRAPVSFPVADRICTRRSAEGCAREPAVTLSCRASPSARVRSIILQANSITVLGINVSLVGSKFEITCGTSQIFWNTIALHQSVRGIELSIRMSLVPRECEKADRPFQISWNAGTV